MGIISKFNSPEAKKSLADDLKSKVGITGSEEATEEKEIKIKSEEAGAEELNRVGSGEPKEDEAEMNKATAPTNQVKKTIKRKETKEQTEDLELNQSSPLDELYQEKLEAFVSEFKENYKILEKENRMVSLQKKNYKNMIKLKVDKVSMSEFINFAIHFTFKSSSYNDIVRFLKKPK